MAQTKNIAIGCIAVVLLCGAIVACVVGGIFVLGLGGVAEKAENEGLEFGKSTDQRGCQDEGLRRLRAALRSKDILKHRERLFLYGCFQSCRATPDFCATVPRDDGFIAVRKWAQEQCLKNGLADEAACADLFEEVSSTCLGKTPRREN